MKTIACWKFLGGNIKLVGDVFIDQTNQYCAYLYLQIGETLKLVAHDNSAGICEEDAKISLMVLANQFIDYGIVIAT